MPSEKFRITTNGQSLRNPSNGFFGMTLSANMTLDESDVSAHNDRRSAHNALERQRREHLNVKFQQLAHALPALQTIRRPSKTMIVAKSLEFVSSSLKRESNFLTEIQKLRLENEKLKKQAQSSSQTLKRQVARDNNEEEETKTVIAAEEQDEEYCKEESVVEDYMLPKDNSSRKRKASTDSSSQQQLSPPPTPEALRNDNKQQQPPKKKRMVKQTKSLQSQLHVIKREYQPIHDVIPWSPLLDEANSLHNTTYPTTTNNNNYFDLSTSYTTTSANSTSTTASAVPISSPIHNSNNNDLLFLTPTPINMYSNMQHQQQTISTSQYHNMMNPMLLSPYFVPTNETSSEVHHSSYNNNSNTGYHQTRDDNFYLS